jgi:hypothetical protein
MTDQTHAGWPKLTTDVDDFQDGLRDGDILLFDSLYPVSQMIKLVDDSPVNHCALF